MSILYRLLFFGFAGLFFYGCNTLYSAKTINIEIAVPAKVQLPAEYRKATVRYNNINVAHNDYFSKYKWHGKERTDTTNIDSLLSKIYLRSFKNTLESQFFFDTVTMADSTDYSDIEIEVTDSDSLWNFSDTAKGYDIPEMTNKTLGILIKSFENSTNSKSKIKNLDPELCLYTENEIKEIAKSTGADLLFSLDYFASYDERFFIPNARRSVENVYVVYYWNIYDLQKRQLVFYYEKMDTISWSTYQDYEEVGLRKLPKRMEGLIAAAEIAGSKFAEFLVPHWTEVQRMYYKSGHIDLKKAEKLLKEGEWKKAAVFWQNNISNKNKSIAAKSMYNLALACEMEGNLDAAIDWTVKSFHIFGMKNEVHSFNCTNYLNILGQRKLDIKTIDKQLNFTISNFPENKNE